MGNRFPTAIGFAWVWLGVAGLQSAGGPPQWSSYTGRMAVTDKLAAVCRGIFNTGDCARAIETYQRPLLKGQFRRSGNTLIIPIEGSKSVVLRDYWSDVSHGRDYSYIEFVPQIGQHLVHVQYYEGQSFWLVDAKSGKRTEICGVPILAPNGSRFGCYDANAEDGSSVEIWRITTSGFRREWVFDQMDWVPGGLVWLNDNSIRILKEDFGGRGLGAAIASRQGSVWGWSDQHGGRPKVDK